MIIVLHSSCIKNSDDFKRIPTLFQGSDTFHISLPPVEGIVELLTRAFEMANNKHKEYEILIEQVSIKYIDLASSIGVESLIFKPLLDEVSNALHSVYNIGKPPQIDDFIGSIACKLSRVIFQEYLSVSHPNLVKSVQYILSAQQNKNLHIDNETLSYIKSQALNEPQKCTIYSRLAPILCVEEGYINKRVVIERISYRDLQELSYFGGAFFSDDALLSIPELSVDYDFVNFDNLHERTQIVKKYTDSSDTIKLLSTIDNVTIVTIAFLNSSKSPYIREKIFSLLHANDIDVILSIQASSQNNVSIAVLSSQVDKFKTIISSRMNDSSWSNWVKFSFESDKSVVAIIGEGMSDKRGVASFIFKSFYRAGVNINGIAQSFSENNISIVVNKSELTPAIKLIYSSYFEGLKPISLFLFGTGNVGQSFLEILHKQDHHISDQGIKLNLVAKVNSKSIFFSKDGEIFNYSSSSEVTKKLSSQNYINPVLIDCTASDDLSAEYVNFVQNGFSIVAANKKANTMSTSFYNSLHAACKANKRYFFYEANVGAGLPVISTLNDIINSGDQILEIQGIFSGTLSWLFNNLDGSVPFSSLVKNAYEMGYTEPNPLEDLSGMDVARKLLILARVSGSVLELGDIKVESLAEGIPEDLSPKSEDFWNTLSERLDGKIGSMLKDGFSIRYVASFSKNGCRAGLELVDGSSPMSMVNHTENLFLIKTENYHDTPMVIKGPGAGKEVTAMGVFGDLIKIANMI